MEFSEPGPPCEMATPNLFRSFMRLYPSAAMSAPRSCLNMTVRMPSLAKASINGLVGKQVTSSTPSVFRIRATASTTFIILSLHCVYSGVYLGDYWEFCRSIDRRLNCISIRT